MLAVVSIWFVWTTAPPHDEPKLPLGRVAHPSSPSKVTEPIAQAFPIPALRKIREGRAPALILPSKEIKRSITRLYVCFRSIKFRECRPLLSFSFFPIPKLWVPRPCDFCKGGNDAADTMGSSCPADCIALTGRITCTLSLARAIGDCLIYATPAAATASSPSWSRHGNAIVSWSSDMLLCRNISIYSSRSRKLELPQP